MPAAFGPSAKVTLIGGRVTVLPVRSAARLSTASLVGTGQSSGNGLAPSMTLGPVEVGVELVAPGLAAELGGPALVVHPGGWAQRHAGVDQRRPAEPATDDDAQVVAGPEVEQAGRRAEPSGAPPDLQLASRGDGSRRGSRPPRTRGRARARTPTVRRAPGARRRSRRRTPTPPRRRRSATPGRGAGATGWARGVWPAHVGCACFPAPDRPVSRWWKCRSMSSWSPGHPVDRTADGARVGRPRRRPAHCRGATMQVRPPAAIIRLDPPRMGERTWLLPCVRHHATGCANAVQTAACRTEAPSRDT